MLTISSRIRQARTPDGAVLLDIARGEMYSLNPVGSKILELLGAGSCEDEIADQLSALCGVEASRVRQDVREFLESMIGRGIVEDRAEATNGR